MAHDGLGSFQQWRTVPENLASRTGRGVLAYNRPGHGRSTPIPTGAWPADWLQQQAALLNHLLDEFDIERPILVGHSDGGSIVLIHASEWPQRCRGVIALSPHSFVEPVCVDAITALRANPAPMVGALSAYHHDAAAMFDAWSGGWVSEGFSTWDVRATLEQVRAPSLVVQGSQDEFATVGMLHETVAALEGRLQERVVDGRLLDGLGHMLLHEAPDVMVELIGEFVAGIGE